MRIINAIHAQSIGGVDQVFRNYTEALVKSNHEVALLISDNGKDNYNFLGVKEIFKLKNKSQITDFCNLLKILISFKPDFVICHSSRLMRWMKTINFFNKIGLIKTKSIAVNHGISFKKSLFCNYIININQEIHDLVVKEGFNKNKSFILPNVINIDLSYVEKSLKKLPVIGIYGRIEERKGFDILIKAANILAQKNYDFKLKIGGFEVSNSYNLETIKEIAKANNVLEKCNFVGIVKDKADFFKDIDILCVPSREEPFGLVILEGFLHSTLVISSNTDGGKLIIEDNKSGFLFQNCDAKNLAEKLEFIFLNPSIYGEITKNAFLKLEKEFGFDTLNKGLLTIFEKVK
jgi:glycosyltransferase involved in cell wall biosynthesis